MLYQAAALLLAAFLLPSANAQPPTGQDPRLRPAYQFGQITNAVTTTRDGRIFVGFPQTDRPSVQVEEITPRTGNGTTTATPFPDAAWNRGVAAAGGDLSHAFVLINALRIGPDGALWLVDAGSPGVGRPAIRGGARLFRIDLATGQVARTYALAAATTPMSYIDDVRFNGRHAYLTDAGSPGLLVLDLPTGDVRRVLDRHPTTTDTRPLHADGKELFDEHGRSKRVHADQLEVSPDGLWLYYLPASGPIARIATRWLDDPAATPVELSAHAEPWLDTPTTGGTAIDADGNIYYGDAENRRILRITPGRDVTTLVADSRLAWVDAMWIDTAGTLWIPANQQNLSPGFNGGTDAVRYPVTIYTYPTTARPSPLDHDPR